MHKCHAIECDVKTHPSKLMCPKHWAMVPDDIQREVVKHFRRDQCEGLVRPSKFWLKAARAAINHVRFKEGKMEIIREVTNTTKRAMGNLCLTPPSEKESGK